MPNLFIEGLTIADGEIYREVAEILVPPEKKSLHVDVTPSQASYPPGAPAKVAVKLTDEAGKPFVGSVALTIYDKGLEHLAGGSNVPAIQPFFWGWRREHDARQDSNLRRQFANLVANDQDRMESIGVFGNRAIWGEPIQYSFTDRSVKSEDGRPTRRFTRRRRPTRPRPNPTSGSTSPTPPSGPPRSPPTPRASPRSA